MEITFIGLDAPDMDEGTDNFAIRTGAGLISLGDVMYVPVVTSIPAAPRWANCGCISSWIARISLSCMLGQCQYRVHHHAHVTQHSIKQWGQYIAVPLTRKGI